MSAEIDRDEPAHNPELSSGELGISDGLTELRALARASALQPLRPIPDHLPAEVRIFADTLRILFGALAMSLNRLAAFLHSDPGTVSRYLSGRRIPPPDFIEGLCKALYDIRGSLVTQQVHQLMHEQFLAALRAHNPARYEVQRLTDLLRGAALERQQLEITAAALEEEIARRNDKIYMLELQSRQLRSAWASTDELLRIERERRERLQQATDGLNREVRALKAQLQSAHRRAALAEKHCRDLETRLEFAGNLLPNVDQGAAVLGSAELYSLEKVARSIRAYELRFVPELLQTDEYARAVIQQSTPGLENDEVERQVALRAGRQEFLTLERPPSYWVIIDETALRRPIGSRDVHLAQLQHLADVVEKPNISVQVMPFMHGGHGAGAGTFTIMRFPENDQPDAVYLEYLTGAHYIDTPEEVVRYTMVMERLAVAATSPNRTRQILTAILHEI
jgi:transcriptional regulator with XRE-family HTH domain